jgi:thioesterase domain-containing protein
VAREDQPGEKRLVAYVVGETEAVVATNELRSYLKERLPEYMIPGVFVQLDEMPLTPNGKVDRRALPAPDGSRPELEDAYVAPRTPVEEALAEVWADALQVTRVGVHDNFFELGGHSLLATVVITRMREILHVELPLRSFFEAPTISGLATSIERMRVNATKKVAGNSGTTSRDGDTTLSNEQTSEGPRAQAAVREAVPDSAHLDAIVAGDSSLVRMQPYGFKQPFFCVHPAGGNVFGFVALSRRLGTERRFYGLQARGLTAEGHSHTSVEDMAAFYLAALRVVQPTGPYFLGGWSMGGVVAYEMAQQLTGQGEAVALLALIDTRAPNPNGRASELDEATLTASFAQDLALSRDNPNFSWEHFLQLSADERLDYVLEQGEDERIPGHGGNLTDMRPFVDVFKANVRALGRYIPQPYVGRVTVLSAGEQAVEESPDPTKGWGVLATEGVECHAVPGNHYSMMREPHVRALAARLKQCLEQTEGVQLSIALG